MQSPSAPSQEISKTFEGVDVGSGTTVFYRPGPDGMEGFVVDNASLVETLKQRVLEQRGLSELVEVSSLDGPTSRADIAVDGGGFYHEFAEPFSALDASLRLAPLDAPFTEQMLMPLTVLLGLSIIFGLFSLYRVVATQLEFARRQNNFVAAVSHELKTPLTAIRMHGEMLRDGLVPSEEKAQESYATITSQAERLSRLIGNVLLLSKIEKTTPTEPTRGDLAATIRTVASALSPHIEKSGFELLVELPAQVPVIEFEPDSVEQVLFNLVDNALKYSKGAQDKRLSLSVEVTEKSVRIALRDRGPGVPPRELEKIFEPFYRLEDELTRKSQGTGLGLALVADLARRMNAQVRATNEEPGLCVALELPRRAL